MATCNDAAPFLVDETPFVIVEVVDDVVGMRGTLAVQLRARSPPPRIPRVVVSRCVTDQRGANVRKHVGRVHVCGLRGREQRHANEKSDFEFSLVSHLEKPDDVSLHAAGLTPKSPDHWCRIAGQRVLRHLWHILLGQRRWSGLSRGLRPMRSHFGSVQ